MKKSILSFVAASMVALNALADEGMWMVSTLSAHTDSVLHSMGLEISIDEIYNTEGRKCLNDAILQFDGGCSASVVSPYGLVFTNHHCGFGSIQQHSTTKHDYLTDGFVAKSFKQELPNPDMHVLFHRKTVDVTDRVLGAIPDIAGKEERMKMIDSIANSIVSEVADPENFIQAEINAFYKGSKYYLSVYQRYNDVRLVYAPPQCLGKFGGDTDNWMWPRQTCDFSVFRIYGTKDGRPANYDKKNVPLHTDKYVRISTQGIQEGSYSMTLGYPGSTDRYLSSRGIQNTMENENAVRYQVRTVLLNELRRAMDSSDALRIQYATKFAHSSNYWKFSLGQNQALENLGVLAEKQALEAKIQQWVSEDPQSRSKYVGLLDSIAKFYDANSSQLNARTLWLESFWSGSDILKFAIRSIRTAGAEPDFGALARKTYKDIDVATDKALLKVLIKNYYEHIPEIGMAPAWLTRQLDSLYANSADAYVEQLFAKSIFARPDELFAVKSFSEIDNEEIESDPMVQLARDVWSTYMNIKIDGDINELERLLGDALREMNHSHEYYPDANFTMRLSYGLCKSIDPVLLAEQKAKSKGQNGMEAESSLDPASLMAEYDKLSTTLPSFLQKHDKNPDAPDFEVIDPVLKWMRSGKFSERYIDPKTGTLPLCFLTTNDITGGNSGSGMYNGKGQLIGLAFDGNWEAMSGDIKFDNSLQRCIGVDIRYVLSVIEDYSHATRLIKELDLE